MWAYLISPAGCRATEAVAGHLCEPAGQRNAHVKFCSFRGQVGISTVSKSVAVISGRPPSHQSRSQSGTAPGPAAGDRPAPSPWRAERLLSYPQGHRCFPTERCPMMNTRSKRTPIVAIMIIGKSPNRLSATTARIVTTNTFIRHRRRRGHRLQPSNPLSFRRA